MTYPKPIAQILATLESSGYAAYVVGGSVRDLLMKRAVHDWDIATSARPEQVMALFERTVPTGLVHGTVTVLLDGTSAEVTTFRRDGGYADGRHPQNVEFVEALQEDLSRRDFTINAMAMDRHGGLTDLFEGRADIRAACLRCVGDPVVRFEEDALRMFRALRFAAQLNFAIAYDTCNAIRQCAQRCAQLSVERIRDELQKTLCSDRPQLVDEMVALGMLKHLGLHERGAIRLCPGLSAEPEVRWALFATIYGTGVLQNLRLPKRLLRISTAVALQWQRPVSSMQRLLAQLGEPAARCYAELMGCLPQLEQVLRDGVCWNLQMLEVSGDDFPQVSGAALGCLLNRLLDHVLEYPQDNVRSTLLTLAENMINGGS